MRKCLLALPALLLCSLPAFADTILPGMDIQVRPDQPIDVARWDRGRIYTAHVTRDVVAQDGDIAIPRGSEAELIVRQVGPEELALDLESITVKGRRYALDTTGPQYHMPQATRDQGSGLLGTIVGALAGANGEQVQPRGEHIRVPADALLTFRLQEPLHVVNWGDPGYQEGGYHYHHDHDWYR